MQYKFSLIWPALMLPFLILGQKGEVYQTFKDTRVINGHSTEVLPGGKLDFRVGHRFGDIAGATGGWQTFYGLESAADIMIGFEYGITDKMQIGINRTKGAGPLKQNINGIFKYQFAKQGSDGGLPASITFYGLTSGSTMQKSNSEGTLNFFPKQEHRFSYHGEILVSRKFSQYFSLQLSGGVTHRNLVGALDQNTIATIGGAARLQLTKAVGILLEGRHLFSSYHTTDNGFYAPVGFAIEWETGGGHVFQMNFTNSEGIVETDYIPYTSSNFLDGEFRLGFTISRLFSL